MDTHCCLVAQSCLTLEIPPGFPVPGILQARMLEWGGTAFTRRSS